MKGLLSRFAAIATREKNLKLPEPDVVRAETEVSEPFPRSSQSDWLLTYAPHYPNFSGQVFRPGPPALAGVE